MSRVFVIGDIHGAYRALRQCLERSGFDYEHDHLISLGDVCDGWPETKACVDELLQMSHLTYLLGNHDWWALEWMRSGLADSVWLKQGGQATVDSYHQGVPDDHRALFSRALLHYVYKNRLFVHAGIDPGVDIEDQVIETLLWDRTLALQAFDRREKSSRDKLTSFDEVYLGHTPIPYPAPIRSFEIWLMDTGAGWSGVLSMMDIETHEIFTSDPVPSLYPGVQGRKKFSQG
jgi:serine/threonine protein phosphatase 1